MILRIALATFDNFVLKLSVSSINDVSEWAKNGNKFSWSRTYFMKSKVCTPKSWTNSSSLSTTTEHCLNCFVIYSSNCQSDFKGVSDNLICAYKVPFLRVGLKSM